MVWAVLSSFVNRSTSIDMLPTVSLQEPCVRMRSLRILTAISEMEQDVYIAYDGISLEQSYNFCMSLLYHILPKV
jgi:hypothetical protein